MGRYRVNLAAQEVVYADQPVKLSWRSFEAFRTLIEANGEIVERDTLFNRLWPGVAVGESSLNQCITRLRKELGEPPEGGIIETIPRRGYRLTQVPVQVLVPDEDPNGAGTPAAGAPVEPVAETDTARRVPRAWRFTGWLAVAVVAALGIVYAWSQWSRQSRARSLAQEGFRRVRENKVASFSAANILFRQALELDRNLAPAYAGIAEVMARSVDVTPGQARAMAERAVRLDSRCAECAAIAGWILMGREWRFKSAAQYLDQAVALNARDPQILLWHAEMLACSGRLERAMSEIDRARSLDFSNPPVATMRAGILYFSGRYEQAIAAAREALGLKPDNWSAYEWIYRSCLRLHRVEEAIAAKAALNAAYLGLSADTRFEMEGRWAAAYQGGGVPKLVEALLAGTAAKPALDHQRYERATWKMLIDDHDGALEELEHVFDFHPFNSIYLGVDPMFAPLHSDRRFRDLMSKIGLAEVAGMR